MRDIAAAEGRTSEDRLEGNRAKTEPARVALRRGEAVGGERAQQNVLQEAKILRANASEREYERLSAALYDDKRREDVRIKLRVLANALVQQHSEESRPVAQAWSEILRELQERPEALDPHRVYDRNPFLLLGAICDLTDECLVDWGVPIA